MDDNYDQIKQVIRDINSKLDIMTIAEYYGIAYEEGSPGRHKALCPFHDDHSPSLYLYTDNDTGIDSWACYVCNDNGDCFRFIQMMSDDFIQAKAVALEISKGGQNKILSEKHKAIQQLNQRRKKLFLVQNQLGVQYRDWLKTLKGTPKYDDACRRVDQILEKMDNLVHSDKYEEARDFIEERQERLRRFHEDSNDS